MFGNQDEDTIDDSPTPAQDKSELPNQDKEDAQARMAALKSMAKHIGVGSGGDDEQDGGETGDGAMDGGAVPNMVYKKKPKGGGKGGGGGMMGGMGGGGGGMDISSIAGMMG